MKTKTIIFLIRRTDSLMTELMHFNRKTDIELDTLVIMYNHTLDVLKEAIKRYWINCNYNKLQGELNEFQLNIYKTEENKVVRKYYENDYKRYWLN